jgi:hypothetical protein
VSPSFITARQWRLTSRAHPGSGRPLCAEAAVAKPAVTITRKGTVKGNLVILLRLLTLDELPDARLPDCTDIRKNAGIAAA